MLRQLNDKLRPEPGLAPHQQAAPASLVTLLLLDLAFHLLKLLLHLLKLLLMLGLHLSPLGAAHLLHHAAHLVHPLQHLLLLLRGELARLHHLVHLGQHS